MARFEGAQKMDRKEARMGFSLGERLKAAGIDVAKSEVLEKSEDDKAEIKAVGSTVDGPEITQVNTEAEQALDENVGVAEARLTEVSEQTVDKESSLEKEVLINQVDRLANDTEEIGLQISGAHKVVEDTMASAGTVPKNLRRLSESYDEGEKGFQGIEESMRDLLAGLATIAATSENLEAGKAKMEELSVRVGIFNRFFKDLLEKKMKLARIDAEKMQERGDGELEDSVEKIAYLNEQFFNDVESLGANCDAVAKGELGISNNDSQSANVEPRTFLTPEAESADEKKSDKPRSRSVDTGEVDVGWDIEPVVKTIPDTAETRKTLRGGFVPRVIEGDKGKTEIAETGPTGTLFGDEKEIESVAKAHTTPELLKDIPYPSSDDRKTTIGEDYLSPEEMEEFEGVKIEAPKAEKDVNDLEGVSLREAIEEDVAENERINKLKNEEEPLSLRELMEKEEETPPPVPDANGESLRSVMEEEKEKLDKEQELMDLLKVFEGVTEITEEDRIRVASVGDKLLDEYKDDYGIDEAQELQYRFTDKFGELFNDAEARKAAVEAKEASSPFVEGAMAAAGVAAAARAVEIGGETQREGDDYRDRGNDGGSFEDTILSEDFTREHWNLLTSEEQNRMLELYSEIDSQEYDLGNLKNAKNAMERAFRAQYGDQFEVSTRAQKTLREKAGQIQKLEVLMLRNINEQKQLQEKAKERLRARQVDIEDVTANLSGKSEADKAWENEEFPAKTSWWKKHPKMRKAAIGGGVLVGAGLFAGAWIASKIFKPLFRPFKTLEFLGNATDKFFKFLDKSIVKGDPVGALSDAVKGSEKFFDEKMKKAESKSKGKSTKNKGIKYSTTE